MHLSASLILSTGLMIVSSVAIRANDSAMNDGAYGPEPVGGFEGKESVIAMKSERLHFTFGKEFTDVSAIFTFHSRKTGAPAQQIVGFPDVGAAVEESNRRDRDGKASWHNEGHGSAPLQHLQTFVDGREEKSQLKYDFVKVNDHGIWQAATPTTGTLMAWYTIAVSFPPDRDVVIERRYRAPNGGSVYGIISFDYLTHTGSNWHGPIGELVTEVELRDGLTTSDLAWDDASTADFQKSSNLVTKPNKGEWVTIDLTHMRLTWDNFKPREEANRRSISLVTKAKQKPEE